ncbi:MAG: hypothetical protein ACLU37_09840 [Collinsella sp.]
MEIPAVDPALPHKMQLKHFVKVVRREVEPVVTPADNVKTLTFSTLSRRPPRPASSSSCNALGDRAETAEPFGRQQAPLLCPASALPAGILPADDFLGGYFAPRRFVRHEMAYLLRLTDRPQPCRIS